MAHSAEPTGERICPRVIGPGQVGPGRTDAGPNVSGAAEREIGLQLLLVSSTPRWMAAVQAAVAEIDGTEVLACKASDALVQIAGGDRFSHLLVEDGCAEGLLEAFTDLTAAHAYTRTSLLLLGSPANVPPRLGVIRSPNRRSVRRALAPITPPTPPDLTGMMPTELRDALTGTMLEARYQPIVRIADREPVALEALARLNHPVRGTLLPDRFVPQIEDAGLALELTQALLSRVLADLGGPFFTGCDLTVTLNFPLDVLLEPAALTLLHDQCTAAGVPPSRVVIELTESRPVEDLPTLRRSVERLRELGYGASIDDVGPAVPRVRPLLDLPFTCLKLDKSLVQQGTANPEALDFLRTTTAAAQARGMTVVAEGVETATLWELMRSIGVDEAQGFLVARPLPPAAVPIWLDGWRNVRTASLLD